MAPDLVGAAGTLPPQRGKPAVVVVGGGGGVALKSRHARLGKEGWTVDGNQGRSAVEPVQGWVTVRLVTTRPCNRLTVVHLTRTVLWLRYEL